MPQVDKYAEREHIMSSKRTTQNPAESEQPKTTKKQKGQKQARVIMTTCLLPFTAGR
jgi:hypothetical protein